MNPKRTLAILVAVVLLVCGLLLWAMKAAIHRHDEALLRTAAAAVTSTPSQAPSAPPVAAPEPATPPPDAPTYLGVHLPTIAPLSSDQWDAILPGQWISDHGDAVNGNHLVEGGFRILFEHAAADSKTPWHLNFMLPTKKTRTSVAAEGGCGFYLSGKAYCRGYGLDVNGKALETKITFEWMDPDTLVVTLGNIFEETVRKP